MFIEPGTLLGRVRLESVIGEGSTATVYRGHHVVLGAPAAVKVLSPRDGLSVPDRNTFLREARIAARLKDPSVVHVYDFGEYGNHCYIVMEYVEGATLEDYLARKEQTSERIIIKLLRKVSRALSVAHAAGLVHRDLKPSNILINRTGQLKVTDFGLAHSVGASSLDSQGRFNGTPAYMAPECCTVGARVDERADLYALGVIGYQLLFGRLPHDADSGDDINAILKAHCEARIRFGLPTHCSPQLVSIVQKLLARRPEARFQSAAQVMEALAALQASQRVSGGAGHERPSDPELAQTSSREFASLSRFFEGRFGDRISDVGEGRVVHSTRGDRGLVWLLLAATVGVALLGYLMHAG